ncbi:hypothetical protein JMJ56_07630 [Belnapia sp. T18]|uniref:Uncharacterized protein n=1 Tax=Belnapia arida TaxID=2804533 RepID=A0ABS1TZL7_9PROT|nr:hypothetical protein [Belnapia arida]MBL6077870.1 hypothetical protein [Belnapia arida]
MRAAFEPLETESEPESPDQSALRLMLSYVEAECLRIGATEAARHAALAVSNLPDPVSATAAPRPPAPVRPRNARLH